MTNQDFKKFPADKLVRAYSTLVDGNMRMHFVDDAPSLDYGPRANRTKFFDQNHILPLDVVSARLEHGNKVEVVGNPRHEIDPVFIKGVDALITGEKGVYLSITMADCPALYLYDAISESVAIAHCGWKGLAKGIVAETIKAMQTKLNVNPHDLVAYIGPHVRSECYRVKRDVFAKFFPDTRFVSESVPLSLESVIYRDLIDAGVLSSHIDSSDECTACAQCNPTVGSFMDYKYFSFRRQRSNPLETQLAVIGMK
jgi:YfiH family protein